MLSLSDIIKVVARVLCVNRDSNAVDNSPREDREEVVLMRASFNAQKYDHPSIWRETSMIFPSSSAI